MTSNVLKALIASSNGYTLELVREDGSPIAVQEGTLSRPNSYRSGETYIYASRGYEIVTVHDDYPAATGRLVLRPSTAD